MNNNRKIPVLAISRLSLYYRALLESRKTDIISSLELANLTGVTAAQVRRDLTYFGQFGTPGKGYQVNELRTHILKILGTDKCWNVALVGVGNLGSAFLSYNGFRKQGFNIICAFDNDVHKIGKVFQGVKIQNISELQDAIKQKDVKMAIVAVLTDSVQEVVNMLVKAGVRAILNFAPIRPQVPDSVQLLNIDLSIELERLAHFLTKNQENEHFFP
jgi:redox-sensing transcriptional repressor